MSQKVDLEKVAQSIWATPSVPDYDKRAVAQQIAKDFELDAHDASELERVSSEYGYDEMTKAEKK